MRPDWEHQRLAVERVLAAIAAGNRRILLTLPTGGGKTRCAARLAERFWNDDKLVTLVTDRRLMVDQLTASFREHGLEPGVRAAGKTRTKDAKVQISSIQTEYSRVKKSGEWAFHSSDLAIIDEAHRHANDQGRWFQERVLIGGGVVVGLTATPIDLGDQYDTLIVAGTPGQLRACGALVPAIHYGPDEPDLRKNKKLAAQLARGDNAGEKALQGLMNAPKLFGRVWKHFERLNPERRPGILFAPGVAESLWFAEQFVRMGVPAAHIDGEDVWINGEWRRDKGARDDLREMSKDGRVKIVCNRFVLREGVDWPWLEHGILATVFGSLATYLQAGGRLLRAYPGKERAVVQDHGGCLDTETQILTARGWVGHKDISDTDFVAGYDRFNGSIRWCPILHRHERVLESGDKMYQIEGRSLNARITGNHRVLFNKRVNDGPRKKWPETFDFVRADELAASDWRVQVPVSGVQFTKGLPLTDDEVRFIGWFLTDGTMEKRVGRTPTTVSITQADHQPQIEDLRACLKGCGFNFTERKRVGGFAGSGPQTQFSVPKGTCKSRPRKGWGPLEYYLNKDLCRQLDLLDERQFGVLLHAIHLGDGAKDRNEGSYRIATGNKAFADNLQGLAVRKGWKCNVYTDTTASRMNPLYVLNMQKVTTSTLHGANAATKDQQAKLVESPCVPGVTRAWCVANELETLVTRRNGMVAIIGNSWWRHGSLNADRDWHLDWSAHAYTGVRADAIRRKACGDCHRLIPFGEVWCRCGGLPKEPEPVRCPKCAAVFGGWAVKAGYPCVTPGCGFVFQRRFVRSRPVVTADGDLVELRGDAFTPRRERRMPDTVKKWVAVYFRCQKTDKTFAQAEALFAVENYYHPPRTLPLMPREIGDWWKRIKDVEECDLTAGYAAAKATTPNPEDGNAE